MIAIQVRNNEYTGTPELKIEHPNWTSFSKMQRLGNNWVLEHKNQTISYLLKTEGNLPSKFRLGDTVYHQKLETCPVQATNLGLISAYFCDTKVTDYEGDFEEFEEEL